MRYLIDSDILVSYLEGAREAIQLVDGLVPLGVSLSIVTYMETYQGVLRASNPALSERRHATITARMGVLPFTETTARTCARLRHQLLGDGRRIRDRSLDLMIAATAIEHNLILLTRNLADYRDVPGLTIY
ncbi:MAG: type II toxin-antitoxin system VapC family toxin [Thermomicrobiales bacterium]|nr:type II toxin-antitoxin system VapC family toxin [Thermomicrobiales bacterium]